jgi:tetratricopeptide (TPR) repeat protein
VGGYDEGVHAGILHIADHHISPGKKQWTWGCGDFGKAWDRNLTDENGPYIELMTGVFTDNQPDFTWLKPAEEKSFTQYFMPYKEVGMVKTAKVCGALGVEEAAEGDKIRICIKLYMTGVYQNIKVSILSEGKELFCETLTEISPKQAWCKNVLLDAKALPLEYVVWDEDDRQLLYYKAEEGEIEIPEPASPVKAPEEVENLEDLYLIGLHLEQYRHATYEPSDYYREGLRRDPSDIRLNTAYGTLLLRRGLFEEAKSYFKRAILKLKHYNPNPYDSEAMYMAGLCDFYLENESEAYAMFRKAAWSKEQQENSFYYASCIKAGQHDYVEALALIDQALIRNTHNMKARGLRSSLLRVLGRGTEAAQFVEETLKLDPFDYRSLYEQFLLCQDRMSKKEQENALSEICQRIEDKVNNYLELSMDYGEGGFWAEAIKICEMCCVNHPMIGYYQGYFHQRQGEEKLCEEAWKRAAKAPSDYCFPNKLWDIRVLESVLQRHPEDGYAWYYLGILWYDKKQYEKARHCYEQSMAFIPDFPTVHRNMALYEFNKNHDEKRARLEMEKAFALNTGDARVFMELDQLYKKLCFSVKVRLANMEKYPELLKQRDDLYTEYITLLNLDGQYQKALDCCMEHQFHPWEGGEGKISGQYVFSLLQLSKKILHQKSADVKEIEQAIQYLVQAKSYPDNLGEGKLFGARENHLDYYLGCLFEKAGNTEQANMHWKDAAQGKFELGNAMYYNDQPADRCLFQGLALQKLGRKQEAETIFTAMMEYGTSHMEDHLKMDYFAVSLPDFLIFDEDLDKKNRVHCNYLIGLGRLGLCDEEGAHNAFEQVLKLDCAHIGVAEFSEL